MTIRKNIDKAKLAFTLLLYHLYGSLNADKIFIGPIAPLLIERKLSAKWYGFLVRHPRNGKYAIFENIQKGSIGRESKHKWIADFSFNPPETLPTTFEEVPNEEKAIIEGFFRYFKDKKPLSVFPQSKKKKKKKKEKKILKFSPSVKINSDQELIFNIITGESDISKNLTKEFASIAKVRFETIKKDFGL